MLTTPEVVADAMIPPGTRRRIATAGILIALVVAAFEGTVVTSAMPSITRQLGGLNYYSWVFSGFLVASTLGVLLFGKLSDTFGRRPSFAIGLSVFLAGSVLCGIAQNTGQLIAFRILQGFGAGAIQPIVMTISADIYSLRERANIQTLFTATWGTSSVLGPIVGAWIVIHGSWRLIFLVNVPIGFVAAVLLLISYRDPVRSKQRSMDLRGPALAGPAMALCLLAFEAIAGMTLPIRACLLLSATLFAWLFLRQQHGSSDQLIPISLLTDKTVKTGTIGGFFAGALLYTCSAYIPYWVTLVAHRDAMLAGAALVPLLVGWAIGSTAGVHVLIRWGMRASVPGGFLVAWIGAMMLLAVVKLGLPMGAGIVALAVLGIGLGPAASTSMIAPQSRVSWNQRGVVTSMIYAARVFGGALAVAALGTLDHDPTNRFVGIATIALCGAISTLVTAPQNSAEIALSAAR